MDGVLTKMTKAFWASKRPCRRTTDKELPYSSTSKNSKVAEWINRLTELGLKIVDVTASANTTIVLTDTGKVFQWGSIKQILPKRSSRLASKNDRDQLLPHPVILNKKAKRVFSGGGANHYFALTEQGDVYAWGINGFGQLGVGDKDSHENPQLVKGNLKCSAIITFIGLKNVVSVAVGQCHTLALTSNGEVYSWGRNAYGQLGVGAEEEQSGVERLPSKLTPQLIPFFQTLKDDKVVQIVCGEQHSAALTEKGKESKPHFLTFTGDVYVWGFGDSYRLGNGEEDDVDSPKKLGGKWYDSRLAQKIACGCDFGLLVVTPKNWPI